MQNSEIKSYFDNHPEINEFHFTADGFAFFSENDADNNARGLTDKTVTKVTREECESLDEFTEVVITAPVTEEALNTDFTVAEEKTTTIVVTQQHLDNNPELVADNVQVGDTIEIAVIDAPAEEDEASAASTTTEATSSTETAVPAVTAIPAKMAASKKKIAKKKTT